MRLYPASAAARTRTATRDLVVVGLLILFAWTGMKLHDGILERTSVGRDSRTRPRHLGHHPNTAGAVEGASGRRQRVNGIPLVGEQLAGTLRHAPSGRRASCGPRATSRHKIVRLGVEQVKQTEKAANWAAGWCSCCRRCPARLHAPARARQVAGMERPNKR